MLKLQSSLVLGVQACARPAAAGLADRSRPGAGLLRYANPLMSTEPLTDPKDSGYATSPNWRRAWAGLVFPGSSLPNALVPLGPITEFGTGAGKE